MTDVRARSRLLEYGFLFFAPRDLITRMMKLPDSSDFLMDFIAASLASYSFPDYFLSFLSLSIIPFQIQNPIYHTLTSLPEGEYLGTIS